MCICNIIMYGGECERACVCVGYASLIYIFLLLLYTSKNIKKRMRRINTHTTYYTHNCRRAYEAILDFKILCAAAQQS